MKTKMQNDMGLLPIKEERPIVLTGMMGQKTVMYFDDEFDKEPITRLINDIEMARQVGGYSVIDLYFSSLGGNADTLFVLGDYLNNIEDIDINFIVNGMVASCGFLILLLIDNEKIHISCNQFSSGLIHLADIYLSTRDQRSSEEDRYRFSKFLKSEVEKLNKWILNDVVPLLPLSDKDKQKISEGEDVMFSGDELDSLIRKYQYNRFMRTERFLEEYVSIGDEIKALQSVRKKMKKDYKDIMNKDIEELLW